LRGYTRAIAQAGVPYDDTIIRTGLRGPEAALDAIEELIAVPDPPTAIFTSQNLLTIGGIRALRDARLQRRVALIGFDDVALGDIVEPAISVVAQDPQAIGRVAAELLFRRMDGDTSSSVHHVVPVELIARGSGEIAPNDRGS
jgi:LacI family transcriptional regulator